MVGGDCWDKTFFTELCQQTWRLIKATLSQISLHQHVVADDISEAACLGLLEVVNGLLQTCTLDTSINDCVEQQRARGVCGLLHENLDCTCEITILTAST